MDRGHARSAGRLIRDLVEWVRALRAEHPGLPTALAGISWGGEARGDRRGPASGAGRLRRPDLSRGSCRSRSASHQGGALQIAWSFFTDSRRTFPIPLSDPALFTAKPEGQAFIAADPFSLREGTAGLLAASFVIDRLVGRAAPRITGSRLS